MPREFKQGEIIFSDYFPGSELHGFGVVLREEEEIYEDEAMLVSINLSGETEMCAKEIYKIAENRICRVCGGVICIDHNARIDDIPYYCPSCEDGMFDFETQEVHMNQFAMALEDTRKRFLPNEDN
jgi:hypothetical protein